MEMHFLETYWLQAKQDFIELDDNFTEEEVDEQCLPVVNTRETVYICVEDSYKDLMRELFTAKKVLEAMTENQWS